MKYNWDAKAIYRATNELLVTEVEKGKTLPRKPLRISISDALVKVIKSNKDEKFGQVVMDVC